MVEELLLYFISNTSNAYLLSGNDLIAKSLTFSNVGYTNKLRVL